MPNAPEFHYTFSRSLYEANDLPAKLAVSGWLVRKGYSVETNPDEMGIDLLVTQSGQFRANVECEIRHSRGWGSGTRFPYSDHQTSVRKHRLLASGNYLMTLNESLTDAILTPMTGSYTIVSKYVSSERGGEQFYAFNLGASSFVRLG
jgi:hypothetical protein